MENLFLTRTQHDALMINSHDWLIFLFRKFGRTWSVYGVTFHNVDAATKKETIEKLAA